MIFAKACVFAAFLIIYLPRIFVLRAQMKMPGGLDNHHPRDQQAKLDPAGKRAQAAHMNAFESFAPFAAAVALASTVPVDPSVVDGLAGTYVGLRLLYTFLYLKDIASARSLVWLGSFAVTAAIFLVVLVR